MGTSPKGGMLVGYARVSTEDQNLGLLQKDALEYRPRAKGAK